MRRPSVAAPPPLRLAAVRSDSKDHVKHATDQERQTTAVHKAEIASALREASPKTLFKDDAATLDNVREAVTTLEAAERTARRVLGGAHPLTVDIERELRNARAALRARETPSPGSS